MSFEIEEELGGQDTIDITFTRVAAVVRAVLKGQPTSYVEAAKTLAAYLKDGDTVRMRIEDVEALMRHVLHLRKQVTELQELRTHLLEESRRLRNFSECNLEEVFTHVARADRVALACVAASQGEDVAYDVRWCLGALKTLAGAMKRRIETP